MKFRRVSLCLFLLSSHFITSIMRCHQKHLDLITITNSIQFNTSKSLPYQGAIPRSASRGIFLSHPNAFIVSPALMILLWYILCLFSPIEILDCGWCSNKILKRYHPLLGGIHHKCGRDISVQWWAAGMLVEWNVDGGWGWFILADRVVSLKIMSRQFYR